MKSIKELVQSTLATLESKPMRESREERLPMSLPVEMGRINNPCPNVWQRKWLRLDCHHPKVKELAEISEKFCGRWYRNERGPTLLVMCGESSTGKTHVASCIYTFACRLAMKAWEAGGWGVVGRVPVAEYAHWPQVTDTFKSGDYSRMDDLLKTDLLVLDDIGAEHDPSKNACDKLCQILSNREFRFTVVTTNICPENWPTKFDTRVADRLLRNSVVVDLTGVPSYTLVC